MTVRVDLNLSLDGVAVPTDQTAENPMGEDWGRLVAAYIGTRTFRERVLHETAGEGTTGVDDRYATEYFEDVGAEIMGAGMFGLHTFPDDPQWRGWWGDEPPFHCPVLVLTHRERPPIDFANGTRFEFLAASPHVALERARELAGGADIRIGGGASVARDFLAAGLVDRLHVAISPIVLGRGVRLWDDLHELERDYVVTSEVAESGVIHVTFVRESE
jgi:dihydrofolate reductase